MGGVSMEWKEVRLGDIVTIRSGLAYKGSFLGKGENILLGMGCVSFKEKFLCSGARPYDADAKEQYCVSSGDIVLATRQQSDNLPILAMPAIIPDNLKAKQIIFGTNLYKIENHSDIDNKYLFWQLKTPHYVDYISSVKTGSVVRMVTKKNVEDYVFKCPPKDIRDKISNLLWSLDRKIELNNKINAQLEEMAQTLFKHWFVDFGPFKNGKFIESELGMIPEGWKVGSIYEYVNIIYGAPYKSSLFTENKDGLPLIRIRDLKDCSPQFYTPELLPNTEYVTRGDIVAGMDAEFSPHIWKGERGLLNQRVCKITPKFVGISNLFVLYLLKPHLEYVQSYKTGTTVSHLGKGDIDRFISVLPPKEKVIELSASLDSILNKICNLSNETRYLSSLRDTLLPKLMSGEIDLSNIELTTKSAQKAMWFEELEQIPTAEVSYAQIS